MYQFTLPQRGTTLCTYFPPPIEPNLCTYTLPNFSNIVYQFNLPQGGTTLCTYFRHPIEPDLCTYTLPNFSNIVTNLPYPNGVPHYLHISPLPLNQICVVTPCPTLVILCTN